MTKPSLEEFFQTCNLNILANKPACYKKGNIHHVLILLRMFINKPGNIFMATTNFNKLVLSLLKTDCENKR